jgi:hypothetical protein
VRSTAFALLFASTLVAGTTAAQTVPPERVGVAKTKRVSTVNAPPKYASRPQTSQNAIEKPSAPRRVKVATPASDHPLRARVSQSSEEDSVIRRVTTIGSSAPHTWDLAIPLPEPDLLSRAPAPDCELKSEVQGVDEAAIRTMKLDYERQCFRQSEFILRARMERLQKAVVKIIQSANRPDRTSRQ